MPITVQVPEGMFTSDQKDAIFAHLTETILDINGTTNNSFARRHLIGDVLTVPEGKSYADGKPEPFVNITVRAPEFSLENQDARQAFVTRMTDYIQEKAEGRLERDRIYINMIWGDAFWGVGGVAYTNETLKETAMSFALADM